LNIRVFLRHISDELIDFLNIKLTFLFFAFNSAILNAVSSLPIDMQTGGFSPDAIIKASRTFAVVYVPPSSVVYSLIGFLYTYCEQTEILHET